MQADIALDAGAASKQYFPFSKLKETANVLIFPDLQVGQHRLQAGAAAGRRRGDRPDPDGARRSRSTCCIARDDVNEIVDMAAIAVVDANNA